MADLTLIDIAKTMPPSKERSVIFTYADNTHVTRTIPIEMAPTGVKSWSIENDLPYTTSATGTRTIGGEYTATKTNVQPFNANIKAYGGRVQYDRLLMRINPGEKVKQQKSQVKAKSRIFTKDVFEGTGGQYLQGIKGMIDTYDIFKSQIRYAGDGTGNASTGGTLTQDDLDTILSRHNVNENTYIYCTRTVGLRIGKMSRGSGGGTAFDSQAIRYAPERFGVYPGAYNGIPVIPLVDGKGEDILSTTSSISNVYIVTYGSEENFTAFHVHAPEIVQMQGVSVVEAFDYEWPVGTAAQSKRCISMIKYVAETM